MTKNTNEQVLTRVSTASTKKKINFKQLFRLSKGSDPIINIAIFLLMIFGSFMIVSTNVGSTTSDSMIVLKTFGKQMLYVSLSYGLMWFVNRAFSFKWFAPLQGLVIIGIWAALFVTQLFPSVGGSKAWIWIGGFSIQPAEFAKPVIVLIIAFSIYLAKKNPKRFTSIKRLYWTPFLTYLVMMVAILLQKDTGTLAILTMIAFICVLVPDYPVCQKFKRILKILFVVGIIAILVLFVFTDIGTDIIAMTPLSHIATRIENFKNPYLDVYGDGYQPANALYGIANSNIFGRGIGGSARKFGYLTQADNDYIFAVLIEETGIFGLLILIVLYGLLFKQLFHYAFKTNVTEYKVILVGNAAYLFMHFFLNVGGVTCLIPMTGVPLLFISNGGSALMAISAMFGISQKCISNIRNLELEDE